MEAKLEVIVCCGIHCGVGQAAITDSISPFLDRKWCHCKIKGWHRCHSAMMHHLNNTVILTGTQQHLRGQVQASIRHVKHMAHVPQL